MTTPSANHPDIPLPPARLPCSYVVTILDEATKTAYGGPLISRTVAAYGNGSTSDTAGTESELVSNVVYVSSIDNQETSFAQGYTSGYKPGNGTGVVLLQQLDGNYLWSLDTSDGEIC
jgi:hypothetical protein